MYVMLILKIAGKRRLSTINMQTCTRHTECWHGDLWLHIT